MQVQIVQMPLVRNLSDYVRSFFICPLQASSFIFVFCNTVGNKKVPMTRFEEPLVVIE